MDIYVWVCFLFIFGTVVEFCMFNFATTQQKQIRVFKICEEVTRRNYLTTSTFVT